MNLSGKVIYKCCLKWLFSGPSNATMCYIISNGFDLPIIGIRRDTVWKIQNSKQYAKGWRKPRKSWLNYWVLPSKRSAATNRDGEPFPDTWNASCCFSSQKKYNSKIRIVGISSDVQRKKRKTVRPGNLIRAIYVGLSTVRSVTRKPRKRGKRRSLSAADAAF